MFLPEYISLHVLLLCPGNQVCLFVFSWNYFISIENNKRIWKVCQIMAVPLYTKLVGLS